MFHHVHKQMSTPCRRLTTLRAFTCRTCRTEACPIRSLKALCAPPLAICEGVDALRAHLEASDAHGALVALDAPEPAGACVVMHSAVSADRENVAPSLRDVSHSTPSRAALALL